MPSGISCVEKLLDKEFSAIFALNDMMAYGVLSTLKRHDLSVPDEISLVGYDDIFSSEILAVPLTTIHQPVRRTSAAAARKLISMIEGEPQKESTLVFQPELVVRKSTALYNPHR